MSSYIWKILHYSVNWIVHKYSMENFFNEIHFDKVELKPVYQIFRKKIIYSMKKKSKQTTKKIGHPKGLNYLSTLIRIIELEMKCDSFILTQMTSDML